MVSSYITFCVDSLITSRNAVTYPNNKPWVTKELKSVINKKKRVFYTGDYLEKNDISREVRNEIRKAKMQHREKIEKQYSSSDLRAVWQGIKRLASTNHYCCEPKQMFLMFL